MSDKVIVSKQDANDLPYVEQEHSGDKYVLLEDIKHWLEEATPVSGEAVCYGNWNFRTNQLSKHDGAPATSYQKTEFYNLPLFTTPQPAPQIKDFDLAYTCKRIRRLLKLLNIPDPSPDNDEVLLGCLFSLLGTACGIIERQQPAPDTVPTMRKPHNTRELVNKLTEVAKQYGQTQQLRYRISTAISDYVAEAMKGE